MRPGLSLRAARGRGAGRAGATLADQLVSSASNFALGVMIARAGGASALGAFGVALVVWLAVVGVSRALVAEPLTVTGSPTAMAVEQRQGVFASALVGVGAAGLLAVGCGVAALAGLEVGAVLALAPWLPGLLAQDFCRAAAFRAGQPRHALASDVVFAAVQGVLSAALLLAGVTQVGAFVSAWGAGALAGTATGMLLLGIPLNARGTVRRLRGLWPRSRWFLAEFCTAFPGDQGYLLLLPLLLGAAQFGQYRAAASLIGPVVVVFQAAGNYGLPETVRALREQGRPGLGRAARRLTAAVGGVTLLYCATVAGLAGPLLALAYGEQFLPAAGLTAFVAAQYVLYSTAFGFGVAIKAADRMRLLWAVRMVTAVVSIAAVSLLAAWAGLVGAAAAAVLTGATYAAGVLVGYRRMWRNQPADPSGRPAPAGSSTISTGPPGEPG